MYQCAYQCAYVCMHTEVRICMQVHIIRMDDVYVSTYVQYMYCMYVCMHAYIIHCMYSATGLIADLKLGKPL